MRYVSLRLAKRWQCRHSVRQRMILVWAIGLALWLALATAGRPVNGAQNRLCGELTTDTILTAANSPYQITCTVTVASGVKLTIQAGVLLEIEASDLGVSILLNDGSSLHVAGTAAAPVHFRSASTTPIAGDWNGIQINAGAHVLLQHCSIQHAGRRELFPALRVAATDVVVEDCTLQDNLGDGIYLFGTDLQPRFADLRILNNGGIAIHQAVPANAVQYRRIVATGNATDAILINGGIVTGQQEWRFADAGLPVRIKGSLTVHEDATLMLEPGTALAFQANASLRVAGRLLALGEAEEPIHFMGTSATPGSWGGIRINDGARAILRHCTIGYGGGLGIGNLQVYPSTTTVESCTIHQSAADGIQVQDGGEPILRQNQIVSNTFGVRNLAVTPEVDATQNWWGDASGPHHPTLNPEGRGNAVSDGVRFDGAVGAAPAPPAEPEEMFLRVIGPRFISPGETANYTIRYRYQGSSPIEDGILTARLPQDAEYLSDNRQGIFWRERQELYWRLGTIQPGDELLIQVKVRYFWGIQGDRLNSLLARIGGRNWHTDELDVTPYLAHTPEPPVSTESMNDEELAALLAANRTLKRLHDDAIDDGYQLLGASLLSSAGREPIPQIILLRGQIDTLYLFADENTALAFRYQPDTFTLRDATGGARYQMSTGRLTHWGSWDLPTEQRIQRVAASFGQCMSNCTAEKFGLLWAASKFSQPVSTVVNGSNCFACVTDGNSSACNACLGSLTRLPLVGEFIDAESCYDDCSDDPDSHVCSFRKPIIACSPGNFFSFFDNSCAYVKYTCDPDTGVADASLISVGLGYTCINGDGCINCRSRPKRCETPPVDEDGDLYGSEEYDYADDYYYDDDFDDEYDDDFFNAATYLQRLPKFPPVTTEQTRVSTVSQRSRPEQLLATPLLAPSAVGSCGGNCDPAYTVVTEAEDPNAKAGVMGDLLPGSRVTYTIDYENVGAGKAFGVFVVDQLGEPFVAETVALPAGASYFAASRKILWEIGELAPHGAPGSKGSVSFSVQLRPDLPSGTLVTNQATVYFPSVPEETPTNLVSNLIQPLIATPQSVTTTVNQPLAIQLIGRDVSETALRYAIVDQPVNGTLSGSPPLVQYSPGTAYVGFDSFTFQVGNGVTTTTAAVSIQVLPGHGDNQPPTLRWTYPAAGQLLSALAHSQVVTSGNTLYYTPLIQADFSEQLATETVTAQQIWLQNAAGERMLVRVRYLPALRRVLLLPLQRLLPGRYTVHLGNGVTDASGNPLNEAHEWSFELDGTSEGRLYLPHVAR